MSQQTKKAEDLSFEEALNELERIVRDLESGKAPLDESVQSYERGVALKKQCEKKLKEAQTKIEKISSSSDGEIKAEKGDDLAE